MVVTHKTGCICCAQNCGLEVAVEDNRIIKVRPDKDNPRSQGYCCRKGLKIAHFQHHEDRLTYPLKRVGDRFQQISWDQALDEIAGKLKEIVSTRGPRSFAYMGGAGQGCHMEAGFGVRLLRGLGSQFHYSSLAQELTGMFWVNGRMLGRQYLMTVPDEQETDMLVAIGWNGWMSHQMAQARRHLKRIADDPDKLLVVIDPRRSETAEKANIHLALRPGTDALLTRAMIAIILREGWENAGYLAAHAAGFADVRPWFDGFDAKAAVRVCELDHDAVREVCRLLATRKWSLHADLGILMNRHSTVSSYLEMILLAVCGRIAVRGGNVIPGRLMPLGAHSDERDSRTWRTDQTDFPAIMGTFPPNVLPEEIQAGKIAAVMVSGANPLRSYADTTAYEHAFSRLELLVTVDVALTEAARLSHYVLPAKSAYEKWDTTFFTWTYPGIYFQLRRPILEPIGEPREESEILIGLADRLGLIPPIPDTLYEAAQGDRMQFGMALFRFAQNNPMVMKSMPFVLGKTLGRGLGSPNLAAIWGLLQTAPAAFREDAARAGFDPGMLMGEQLFQALLDHPEGMWIGRCDPEAPFKDLRTSENRVELFIPELADWVESIDSTTEEEALRQPPDFPLILVAGRHFDYTANTIMRDPAWTDGRQACTLLMHPQDADALSLQDGQRVRVSTVAGSEEIEVEITDTCRPGQVVMPHGCGLVHGGKTYGANVNRLTPAAHRDRLAATPYHKFVPCRVEAV